MRINLNLALQNKRFVKIWEFRSTDKKILYSLHFIAVDQQVRSFALFAYLLAFLDTVWIYLSVCIL
jgi:hypothetical protein